LLTCVKGNDYSFIKEFKVSTPLDMKISTSGGSISVTSHDKDIVEVAFIVKKRNQLLHITLEELKNLVDIDITNDSNFFQISVEKSGESNISVGFEIKAPRKSSCILHTSGGSIKASDLEGAQELHTSGGSLVINNITGKLDGKTSGGSININNTNGDLVARTSGGSISLENINGKVDVSTSGGGIDITNSKFDVTASTSGGSIDLTDAHGQIDLNTSGGSISLKNVSGSIEGKTSGGGISGNITKLSEKLVLKTSGGGIDVNVPSGLGMNLNLSANRVHTQLKNFSGSADKGKIVGQVNGGGIWVELATSGGDVTLNYK
jgi:hypothetical protein